MSKNVHIAFQIDDEDEPDNKSIEKAREALATLKTVRQALAMDITLVTHCIRRWATRTNIPSEALSYFWLGPSCNGIAPQVRKTVRVRMDRM